MLRSRLLCAIVGGALLPAATTLSTSRFAPRVAAARSLISMAATEGASEAAAPEEDTIVQFVVIRKDLLKTLEWPTGSVVAQACHACTAVIWANQQDPCVQEYLSAANVDSMHKVLAPSAWPTAPKPSATRPPAAASTHPYPARLQVVKECKGETQLLNLAEKLTQDGIVHKLWVEQPENFPTALALKPYPRSQVAPLLKKYNLYK